MSIYHICCFIRFYVDCFRKHNCLLTNSEESEHPRRKSACGGLTCPQALSRDLTPNALIKQSSEDTVYLNQAKEENVSIFAIFPFSSFERFYRLTLFAA